MYIHIHRFLSILQTFFFLKIISIHGFSLENVISEVNAHTMFVFVSIGITATFKWDNVMNNYVFFFFSFSDSALCIGHENKRLKMLAEKGFKMEWQKDWQSLFT